MKNANINNKIFLWWFLRVVKVAISYVYFLQCCHLHIPSYIPHESPKRTFSCLKNAHINNFLIFIKWLDGQLIYRYIYIDGVIWLLSSFNNLTRCVWSVTNVEPHREHGSTKQKVVLIDAQSERVPADTESAGVMERTDHLAVRYFEGHGYLS